MKWVIVKQRNSSANAGKKPEILALPIYSSSATEQAAQCNVWTAASTLSTSGFKTVQELWPHIHVSLSSLPKKNTQLRRNLAFQKKKKINCRNKDKFEDKHCLSKNARTD